MKDNCRQLDGKKADQHAESKDEPLTWFWRDPAIKYVGTVVGPTFRSTEALVAIPGLCLKYIQMRISGSYFERLLIVVLPLTFIGSIFGLMAAGFGKPLLLSVSVMTLLFWLIDSIWIFFKKPKSLTLKNGIYLGDEKIDVNSIAKIVNFNHGSTRWEIEMIEFTLNDGRVIFVLDKPHAFFQHFLSSESSKTITLLLEKHPKLRTKLRKTMTT